MRVDVMNARTGVAVVRERVVRHLFTEVALDRIDAEFPQLFVFIAPPYIGCGIGEIDETRWRQRRKRRAERRGLFACVPFKNQL